MKFRSILFLIAIFLVSTSATTFAAGPQGPSCGIYKVTKKEVIAGHLFQKGRYEIHAIGIDCKKVLGNKGLFAQFLRLKDKDPLPKPWKFLKDAVGAPKFTAGDGIGFRVQLLDSQTIQKPIPTPTESVSVDSKPEVNPVPSSTVSVYTMEQVRANNSATSCWTVIEGMVYDLTKWISKHPGGVSQILGLCGVDGSEAFKAQHASQSKPNQSLDSFKLGSLSN